MSNVQNRVNELAKEIADARAAYHEQSTKGNTKEAAKLHAKNKELGQELADLITAGAAPCPGCGKKPHGLRQPNGRGGFEYEIGCLTCKPIRHSDGTHRQYRVRGGLLPKHAAEAWNEGPAAWLVAK